MNLVLDATGDGPDPFTSVTAQPTLARVAFALAPIAARAVKSGRKAIMRYPGKIDWWIGLAVLTGLFFLLTTAIYSRSIIALALFAADCVLVFGFCYPQSYDLTPDELIINAGLRRTRIPLSQITAVQPSSDSRSSLALSLDRVLIEYASGSILIAPENQSAFIADILRRTGHLAPRGQGLTLSFVA